MFALGHQNLRNGPELIPIEDSLKTFFSLPLSVKQLNSKTCILKICISSTVLQLMVIDCVSTREKLNLIKP
jgi:hypothetical protein